jgi:adenylate cyclase
VFLLNRYSEVVGTAIERAGGMPNQFTGDGVMALFGVESGPDDGCRCALIADQEIVRSLHALSQMLVEELDAPLQVGLGIHAGPAIVGQMGVRCRDLSHCCRRHRERRELAPGVDQAV